jgi:hypothetical protein
MRTLLAGPFPPAGRLASTLALALTLCACGGGGDGEAADAPDSTAQRARTLASNVAGPPECAPPPAITDDTLQGSWKDFQTWLSAHSVAFTDSDPVATTDTLQLCDSCGVAVPITISSENRTYCLRGDSLVNRTRIAGAYRVGGTTTAWGQTFRANDSIYLFAHGVDGLARLAYRAGDSVAIAPDSSWKFNYCNDGVPHNRPQGRWKKQPNPRNPNPGGRDDFEEGEEGPGTYGWMACASGCCQFYIPPPNPSSLPPQANEKAQGNVPPQVPPGRGRKPPCPDLT